jgi:hypothetical protein
MRTRIDIVSDWNETKVNWRWHKVAQDTLDLSAHLLDERAREFLRNIRLQRKPLTERQCRYIHFLYCQGIRDGPPEFVVSIDTVLRME